MDNLSKSKTVHRHFHYHYHYDLKDNYIQQTAERYSSPSVLNLKKSHLNPYKASWKNHINPQVTKLYDEISLQESFDDNFTPKASRLNQKQSRSYTHTTHQFQSKRSPISRAQILQDISAYQDYLKTHSQPNLYIPNIPNLKKIQPQYSPQLMCKKFVSLNEIFENKQKRKQGLQDIILTRTDSKLLSTKHQISTMHETQNPRESFVNLTQKKIMNPPKYVRQSQIKSPSSYSNVFQKAKIRMSYIEDPIHTKEAQELDNSSFSLFQREAKKQQSGKISDVSENSLRKDNENEVQNSVSQQDKKNAESSNYALDLMRQQCNFLRNKFIDHAAKEHGVQF